jgi:hypothetical protein
LIRSLVINNTVSSSKRLLAKKEGLSARPILPPHNALTFNVLRWNVQQEFRPFGGGVFSSIPTLAAQPGFCT